ncbi:S41 family peptidase [Polaribacter sp. Asnod1-A03]|uniref:S41 family peptidase n=1 Tax=Polaribacter sp. Asnod1-A03 TaxID=3160581 RepID=UPI00386B17E9
MRKLLLLSLLFCGNIFSQTQLPNSISKTEKIYGLSKFWKEANSNFVYINKIDKQKWESDYISLIGEVQDTKNDYEYYRLLQKFCASLKDGHTNVWMPKSLRDQIYNGEFDNYKISLKNIDEKAIVTQINLSKKQEIPIGTEILEVNEISVKEYINQYVKPYISTSSKHILENRSISELLRAPKGTVFNLKIRKPNGELTTLKLTSKKVLEKEVFPSINKRQLLDFKWINTETVYVSLNSFSDPKIDSIFIDKLPEIKKAKKLVIDLRYNGGGNSNIGLQILKYLTYDNELEKLKSSSRLHIPTFKAWGLIYKLEAKDTLQGTKENIKLLSQAYLTTKDSYFYNFPYSVKENEIDKSERIVIPTVLLIGNNTASAAEDFLVSADNQKHMTKIGEPTYGSTGQPMLFDLPGGATGRICTKKDTYPDGREFVGYGIQPDILVKKTYQDYINDKDPVLEKAIKYLNKE